MTTSVHRIADLRQWRTALRRDQAAAPTVGFVPTMGALHDGHLALMRLAREQCDFVVVSVFVNPTQFGPGEDYEVYPRDEQGDLELCASVGVDQVWFGDRGELYPAGFATQVELPALARELCGRRRPGHFAGVALIVAKLFQVVTPERAYFGWKDYQQCVLLRQMARDLHFPVEIVGVPIVREPNGLARSSRNERLTPDGRAAAAVLYRSLVAARDLYRGGAVDSAVLIRAALEPLIAVPAVQLEYLEVVNADTLAPVRQVQGVVAGGEAAPRGVMALAAHVDGVRLIDNIFLDGDSA